MVASMDKLSAAQRVLRRLEWQRNRFLVSRPDFYNTRREYWRHVWRGYRRFWIDLYRGRPWLEMLLAVFALLLVLSVLEFLIYQGYFNREVSEKTTRSGNDMSEQAFRFIIAVIMLCIPINYWFFRRLQFPLAGQGGRAAKDPRLVWKIKREDRGVLVTLKWLFWGATTVATVCVSFLSLWSAIGVFLSAALLWWGGRIVFRVGDLIFTAWNQYSPEVQIGQRRYWTIRCLVFLNLFALLALPSVADANILPDYSWIPVTGWWIGAVIGVSYGSWQAAMFLLAGLGLAIATDYGLKRCQQSVAWRREYLTKTKIHQWKDPSFQRALEIVDEEKVKEEQGSVDRLVKDLSRLAERGYIGRYFASLENLHIVCLCIASLFPVALMLMMHQITKGVPVEEMADFHQGIGLMWCIPMLVCIGFVQLSSSQFLRVRSFGESPISLLKWWNLYLANSGLMLVTYWLICLPGIATIGYLFGGDYPWLQLGAAMGYLSLLAVSICMIVASLLAMSHLWCLVPRWVRWFEGDVGGLVLIAAFIGTLFSGLFIAGNFKVSVTNSMIAAMMAAPPLLAIATMAYTYVLIEQLGGDGLAVKK